ncbi:MAG: DUF4158 domain-containing protein, partial [Pseudomonadales bacterium]|nr:DUF4158 domain-containing protein [Pseudomonadales bacterium]
MMKMLGIDAGGASLTNYQSSSYYSHQENVLQHLKWITYGEKEKDLLFEQAQQQASQQQKPRQIFESLVDYCWKHRITLPQFTELSEHVTDSYNEFENTLLDKITSLASRHQLDTLDHLIEYDGKDRHPITLLKKINQSLQPRDISRSVVTTQEVGEYFFEIETIIENLDLSKQATEYFSTWVQKARISQLTGLAAKTKIYLYLMSYVRHQFYIRQDALCQILLKTVKQASNNIIKELHSSDIKTRRARNKAIAALTKSSKDTRQLVHEIKLVSQLNDVTPSEKYYKIEALLAEFDNRQTKEERRLVQELEEKLNSVVSDGDLYKTMERLSRKLQLRVSGILQVLEFNEKESNVDIIDAITYFRMVNGKVSDNAPTSFLTDGEYKFVNKDEAFNVSLYKFLLFKHVADAIKSGELNLRYSYQYRSINDYLINMNEWQQDRDKLLRVAGLD